MPSKANRSLNSIDQTTFTNTLLQALEHFNDPIWLGEESPLATPYLLGTALNVNASDAKARGKVLQNLLREALKDIDGKDAKLHSDIIQLRFFLDTPAIKAREVVGLERTQYFEHQKRALAHFEPYVLAKLNPAIRLEAPIQLQEELLERQSEIENSLAALRQKQTVMLLGSGGMGKTSLGSYLARVWGQNVFWFTVRPGVNDHLSSFVFEFAFFCHRHAASALWHELLANNSKISIARLPSLIRHTLAAMPAVPLLCIDEVDLLTPTQNGDHAQLTQLWTSLRSLAPLLLMGQSAVIEADHYETLSSFSLLISNIFFKQHRLSLNAEQEQHLYRYTAGNPRLLQLLVSLQQSGESIDDLLEQLPQSPSIEFLLGRILQRLDRTMLGQKAIGILMELAVIQVTAPVDEWQKDPQTANALFILRERRLVQEDNQGGVSLLPAYRDVIIRDLPQEKKLLLHRQAAGLFQAHVRYTLAAYHYCLSDIPETAVWLWRDEQREEMNGGQAYFALTVFRTMATMPISNLAREQVMLFCATLENLIGNAVQAQSDLRSILWKTPLLQLEADQLRGEIANDQSQFEEAERIFRRAIQNAEQLVEARLAHLYKGLGWRYRQERDLDQAWNYMALAQYEVSNLQGLIQCDRCQYDDAIEQYNTALQFAQSLKHDGGIAKTAVNLGRIYATLGQFEQAEHFYQMAEETYRQMGQMGALDGMKINQALLLNLAGEYARVTELLLPMWETIQRNQEAISANMRVLVCQNLAEAFLGLGLLENAETYIQMALAEEEIIVLPDSWRTYGEIRFQQKRYEEAIQSIKYSINVIEENDNPDFYLAGYAWRSLAQVYLAQGKSELAKNAKEKAIQLFERINLPHEMKKTEELF